MLDSRTGKINHVYVSANSNGVILYYTHDYGSGGEAHNSLRLSPEEAKTVASQLNVFGKCMSQDKDYWNYGHSAHKDDIR